MKSYNIPGTTEVASSSLLKHMSQGGAENAFMIIRKEKWDMPQFSKTKVRLSLLNYRTRTWLRAAWMASFTKIIEEKLEVLCSTITYREIYLGYII